MPNLLAAAEDALAELEALITGRGAYADGRTVGPNAGKVADRLQDALEEVDSEYLASVIEERAREMIVKTEIGLGGDRAAGFHDGFVYGLLWGGVLSEEAITEAHERGVARGLEEIEERKQSDDPA